MESTKKKTKKNFSAPAIGAVKKHEESDTLVHNSRVDAESKQSKEGVKEKSNPKTATSSKCSAAKNTRKSLTDVEYTEIFDSVLEHMSSSGVTNEEDKAVHEKEESCGLKVNFATTTPKDPTLKNVDKSQDVENLRSPSKVEPSGKSDKAEVGISVKKQKKLEKNKRLAKEDLVENPAVHNIESDAQEDSSADNPLAHKKIFEREDSNEGYISTEENKTEKPVFNPDEIKLDNLKMNVVADDLDEVASNASEGSAAGSFEAMASEVDQWDGPEDTQHDNEHTPQVSESETSCQAPDIIHKAKKGTDRQNQLAPRQLYFNEPSTLQVPSKPFKKKDRSLVSNNEHPPVREKNKKKLFSVAKKMEKTSTGAPANESEEADLPGELGTWVQCSQQKCKKWRYLPDVYDPMMVPDLWTCTMHADSKYNSCEKKEQEYDESDHIFTRYTLGSLVWAKMDGYPWWPGIIDTDPDYDIYCEIPSEESMSPTGFHIVFLDERVTRAWIKTSRIRPLSQPDLREISPYLSGHKFRKGVSTAMKKAQVALDLPLQERLHEFGFAAYAIKHSVKPARDHREGDSRRQKKSKHSKFEKKSASHKPRSTLERGVLVDYSDNDSDSPRFTGYSSYAGSGDESGDLPKKFSKKRYTFEKKLQSKSSFRKVYSDSGEGNDYDDASPSDDGSSFEVCSVKKPVHQSTPKQASLFKIKTKIEKNHEPSKRHRRDRKKKEQIARTSKEDADEDKVESKDETDSRKKKSKLDLLANGSAAGSDDKKMIPAFAPVKNKKKQSKDSSLAEPSCVDCSKEDVTVRESMLDNKKSKKTKTPSENPCGKERPRKNQKKSKDGSSKQTTTKIVAGSQEMDYSTAKEQNETQSSAPCKPEQEKNLCDRKKKKSEDHIKGEDSRKPHIEEAAPEATDFKKKKRKSQNTADSDKENKKQKKSTSELESDKKGKLKSQKFVVPSSQKFVVPSSENIAVPSSENIAVPSRQLDNPSTKSKSSASDEDRPSTVDRASGKTNSQGNEKKSKKRKNDRQERDEKSRVMMQDIHDKEMKESEEEEARTRETEKKNKCENKKKKSLKLKKKSQELELKSQEPDEKPRKQAKTMQGTKPDSNNVSRKTDILKLSLKSDLKEKTRASNHAEEEDDAEDDFLPIAESKDQYVPDNDGSSDVMLDMQEDEDLLPVLSQTKADMETRHSMERSSDDDSLVLELEEDIPIPCLQQVMDVKGKGHSEDEGVDSDPLELVVD